MSLSNLRESAITILGESSRIEGKFLVDSVSRLHGEIVGEIHAADGSTLILAETSVVEGTIQADTLLVDGYVRGDIHARKRVVISSTGRVVGNIRTPSLQLDFGAYFEGDCLMNEPVAGKPREAVLTRDPAPTPV